MWLFTKKITLHVKSLACTESFSVILLHPLGNDKRNQSETVMRKICQRTLFDRNLSGNIFSQRGQITRQLHNRSKLSCGLIVTPIKDIKHRLVYIFWSFIALKSFTTEVTKKDIHLQKRFCKIKDVRTGANSYELPCP